jgi:D-alanyl-D-alanine carboxypeptidase
MNITPQSKITPREVIGFALKQPPLFPPGAKWYYCNTNYLLLGLIIEAVSHHSVEEEIRNRLLVPLRLRDTSFPTTDPSIPPPFAHGYALGKDGTWQDNTVSLPPALTWSAGVMISDMADMKIWVKDYVTGTTNSSATQKERLDCGPTTEEGLRFGLGVGCSGGWFGYTGGIPGYNTAVYYLPPKNATIIVFVNSQIEKPAPGVANSIVRDFTRILLPGYVAFQ